MSDDIRFKTLTEICELVHPLVPDAAVRITRKDRHNATSQIEVVIIETDAALGFMKLTEVAGAFDTPNIEIMAIPNSEARDFDPLDPELRLTVRW